RNEGIQRVRRRRHGAGPLEESVQEPLDPEAEAPPDFTEGRTSCDRPYRARLRALSSPARAKALAVQHRRPALRNRSTADSARPACVGWVKPTRAKPLIGGFHPPYNPEQPAQATLGDVIQPTRRRVGVRPNRQEQMLIRYGKSAKGNRENLN